MAQHPMLNKLLDQQRTLIMGIINTTPDSFSDGGLYSDGDAALRHGLSLVEQGANLLDIGGESTRPGAEVVTEQEEMDRVIPVIERLSQATDIPISIDTHKPAVMRAALAAGAQMVNDVKALSAVGALDVVSEAGVPVCLMHMQGEPSSMQNSPQYVDVVDEVVDYLISRVEGAVAAGIDRSNLIVDPGIGFGKTLTHNLRLLSSIAEIRARVGCPVLIGVSRKSMIDALLGRSVSERVPASIGLATQAALNGAAILRVHDVHATHDAVRSAEAVARIRKTQP